MTHFTCLVQVPEGTPLNKDCIETYIDDVLAPYSENLKVAPYIEHRKSEMHQLRLDAIAKDEMMLKDPEHYNIEAVTEYLEQKKKMTDEEYFDFLTEGQARDIYGNAMSSYNKDSKWDWYEIGGRFKNLLLSKEGEKANFMCIKDFDAEGYAEARRIEAEEMWEEAHRPETDDMRRAFIYGIGKETTKEEYLDNAEKGLVTCAVVDKTGVWYEPAKMGWWACTYDRTESQNEWEEKFEERFLKPLDPEDIIVVVDCQI